jgi:hypothetical protein
VGDTGRLRALLLKAESDAKFYRSLEKHSQRLAHRVDPATEIEAWRRLLACLL